MGRPNKNRRGFCRLWPKTVSPPAPKVKPNADISYPDPAPLRLGGTGDSPVPVGDSPTGTGSDGP